jgi:serine-type D-Ala-D-Ala carboxypeptidase (penicillin-binding protein 5/6)
MTAVVVCALVVTSLPASPALARGTGRSGITARAAILIDSRTGEVLWQRNPDLRLPPASTTKVLTGLIAIESGRLGESFPVSAEAAAAPPSKINVRPGWRFRLRDLVYAILLNSANDASVVTAEGLGGSIDGFAARMNAEAHALGAVNSHFVNPHGLPARDHYSTARDLTTIFAAGLKFPLFRQILETKRLVISPTAPPTRTISLHSHNRLLMSDYPIPVIGKTGWTIAAKKCFVGAADVDGRELLVAMLGSRDLWGDLKRLIGAGTRNEPATTVASAGDWSAGDADQTAASGDDDDPPQAPIYEVQLASFRHPARAHHLRKAVAKNGYRAKVTRVGSGKRTRYRVTVGSYKSRQRAQRTARKLNRAHRINAIVVRVGA